MRPTLLILAAGIGSRYGGLKQVDQVGPSGEAILDYSIYDAIRAGFKKVVFIIRKNIEKEMREVFERKLSGRIEVDFIFQELDMIPEGYSVPPDRVKPWGTAHAVSVAAAHVREPFLVINADDYYGPASYRMTADYLMSHKGNNKDFCMVGYQIQHTLSEFGPVSRGLCEADEQDYLRAVVEITEIENKDGKIAYKHKDGHQVQLKGTELVSMNVWGFTPAIFPYIDEELKTFLSEHAGNPKAELYIPTIINNLVKKDTARVKILPAADNWFGVTYREDKPMAVTKISHLISGGVYPANLWP